MIYLLSEDYDGKITIEKSLSLKDLDLNEVLDGTYGDYLPITIETIINNRWTMARYKEDIDEILIIFNDSVQGEIYQEELRYEEAVARHKQEQRDTKITSILK